MKYEFVLRKTQDAIVEIECDSSETVGEITEKIEEMSEEELEFNEPQFDLLAITKKDKKISKLIWRAKSYLS